jgi:hypothetical protein
MLRRIKMNSRFSFPARLILASLVIFSNVQVAIADTEIFGYFENRFFLVQQMAGLCVNKDTKLGDYNRLRLKVKASPSEKVVVNLALDFYSFHGVMTSPLGTYDGTGDPSPNTIEMDVDRAYIDLYFKHFDLSIGKQRVAIGVSYIWAPLDIFNRVNILEPREEKPGTNALKLYIPFGTSSSLTAIYSPEEDFESSRAGLRAKTHIAGIDLALTYIWWGQRELSVYGVDVRGENFVGWWVEGGYFVYPWKKDKKLVVGFDYTFPVGNGLYWLNEYFYDSSGARDPLKYDYNLLLKGDRFTLGQKYFFSTLSYSFNDFLSTSFSYIANWGDGSYYLSPSVKYDITQNIGLTSGVYLPLGKETGEFKSSNSNVFFVWVKVNF